MRRDGEAVVRAMARRAGAWAVLVALLAWAQAAAAASVPVYGRNGMAASAEPLASRVGVEVLQAGGNAFDAAAAMGFALAVVYPRAGNLGGGGFCVALTADGETWALDFRETAPAGATRDMFLDAEGNVVPGLSLSSYLAVGVPGSPDGLLRIAARGKLERAEVLAPAIRLARQGFAVPKPLADALRSSEERLTRFPGTAKVFYEGGEPPAFGAVLKQPDLATTLEAMARDGRAGFYEGRVARLIAGQMKAHGGLVTRADLAGYRSEEPPPFVFERGGLELITMPLPSSGGVTMDQILGLVDLDALRAAGWNSAHYVQRLVEAERLAYADRNYFLGDPDFVDVPVQRLVSPAYLARRRALMPTDRAGSSAGVSHGRVEGTETTHYAVADRWGNVVAVTTTLNGPFGMGAVVDGAGVLLNNEMDDFAAKPGVPNMYGLTGAEANAIAPGKRMLSSMTPTIVRRDGTFFFTTGSPGGSTIITTVLQSILNVALFQMNIRDAIDAPRFHHQWLPDTVMYEERALSADTRRVLEGMGYHLDEVGGLGQAAGIMVDDDGTLTGWADRRGYGAAVGY